jgi:hypothetical protein
MNGSEPSSGEDGNAISPEGLVARDDGQAARERLRDDHAVERVAVMERQARRGNRVREFDRDHLDGKRGKLVPEVGRDVELAGAGLDLKLPDRDDAEEEAGARIDALQRAGGELAGLDREPEQRRYREEEPSSGFGAREGSPAPAAGARSLSGTISPS